MFKTLLFLFAVLSATAAQAQTQYSNIYRDIDSSGFSILLDGKDTEILICEGGCGRYRVSNFRETADGFYFSIMYWNKRTHFQGKFYNNKLLLKNTMNPSLTFVLHDCRLKPSDVTCYNHAQFRLNF